MKNKKDCRHELSRSGLYKDFIKDKIDSDATMNIRGHLNKIDEVSRHKLNLKLTKWPPSITGYGGMTKVPMKESAKSSPGIFGYG